MSLKRAGVVFAVVVAVTFDALPALAAPSENLFAAYQVAPPSSAGAGTTLQLPATVMNTGTDTWNTSGPNPVNLSYHWLDASGKAVVWDGARTPLGPDVPGGAARRVGMAVPVPSQPGAYPLQLALVKEGIAWLNPTVPYPLLAPPAFNGTLPLKLPAQVSAALYAATYSISATTAVLLGESRTVAVTVTNNGNVPWSATGQNPVNLAYHVYAASGAVVVWDGARTGIGSDLLPGQSRSVNVAYTAPSSIGTYALAVDTVREGVAWLSQLGSPAARTPLVVTSGFNGGYDQTTTPGVATIGASLMINVRVSNYGARAWPAAGPNPVHLSYHILTAGGGVVTWDGRRGFL